MKNPFFVGIGVTLMSISAAAAQAIADPYADLDLADRDALATRAQTMFDECAAAIGPQQTKCGMDCSRSARLAPIMPQQRNEMFFRACVDGYRSTMANLPAPGVADAVQTPPSTPAAPQPEPASWTPPLPGEIVNAKPIAGSQDHINADADNYLLALGSGGDIDKSCVRENYEKIRAAAYRKDMEDIATEINLRIRQGHAPDTFGPVNAETIPTLCKDQSFLDAFQFGHPLPDGGHRFCAEPARAPEADYVASANNLGLKFPTICLDLNQIKAQEKNSCAHFANSQLSAGRGLGKFETAEGFCECSGDETATYFAAGDKTISSKSKVAARTQARTKCMAK